MPSKRPHECLEPGCRELVRGVPRCAVHTRERERSVESRRGSSCKRGYGSKWQKARSGFLKRNPLCCRCAQEGKVTAATVVDHKIPHRGNMKLFWDVGNWQPLCKRCHDVKTATEDRKRGRGVKFYQPSPA